jgi:malonate decarboxylase beta subunit
LQEANAGLIAVSEIMRAILAARAAGIAVVAAIGGQYGCFGGMGIAAACCAAVVMSEEGRWGLSGPEVIETAQGVEEFDARDRALVWRTTGGKHRYLLDDCCALVDDDVGAFRAALIAAIVQAPAFSLAALEVEHALLAQRVDTFGDCADASDIWQRLGWEDPQRVPLLPTREFVEHARTRRAVREPAGGAST